MGVSGGDENVDRGSLIHLGWEQDKIAFSSRPDPVICGVLLKHSRTRLIVGVGPRSINGSVKRILQEQGWRGLFAGNAINAIRCAPCQAVELSTFEAVKRMLFSMQHQWEQDGPPQIELLGQCFNVPVSMISTPAVAGAVAGVVSTLLTYPLEVLKVNKLPAAHHHHPCFGKF